MKAGEARLLELIDKAPQFVIPIYQRTYSWTERECRQLWEDLIRSGKDKAVAVHFVGSIVYVMDDVGIALHAPALVIDGQQRITMVMLLIAALAKTLESLPDDRQEPFDGFSPVSLRSEYLINGNKAGDKRYKLLLTQTDKDTLSAIVDDRELPPDASIRVNENYALFRSWIRDLGDDLEPLCIGLAKLMVVDVSLNRQFDNPQLIFESMNSTGKELSQADLIRNFVLMGLATNLQNKLYGHYWRPMEREFGQAAYSESFDNFVRDYLTVKTGVIPNLRAVYDAFKAYARRPDVAEAGIEALVAELRRYARFYAAIALGRQQNKALQRAFHDLRELKVDVAYPFLLEMYADYDNGLLTPGELEKAVRLVEAYVFRRAVCAIPTNSLNKTFATFARTLDRRHYLESIEAQFLTLPSYRRFPSDEEFAREIQVRDLYNFPRRSYWLRRLENHAHPKEPAPVNEYTIEHIMPQNERLSNAWRDALGPDWERVHKTWLHTLGNLTLTGYNAEFSDRPFREKRDLPHGGFKTSPLHLNVGLGQIDTWNEATIRQRGERLAAEALAVWPAPSLDPATLTEFHAAPAPTIYSIEDHPNLQAGPMRELFDAFRRQTLELDPCVTEEFLKTYVAYKAETNFVDVVPQAKQLRLWLNMPFPELDDPRHMAKDVTNIGHWGNGDVEIRLCDLSDLPYVMGLVRQSFERQMGSGDGS